MRFNELISGVRADVAVKIFGDDLDVMAETAEEIEKVLAAVPGAADVKTEQTTGLPILSVNIDRARLARYGLNIAEVQEAVEIAMGGKGGRHAFRRRPPLPDCRATARTASLKHRRHAPHSHPAAEERGEREETELMPVADEVGRFHYRRAPSFHSANWPSSKSSRASTR